jgi:cell division FtsZ-interacting protein ZapD
LYQHPKDISTAQLQMIRVQLDSNLELIPEVSGYKQHFNVRFMEANKADHLIQTTHDINFSLTCCIF